MTRKTWSLLLSLMLALGGVGLFFGCGDDDGGNGAQCGNGILEEGEQCDTDNLDGTTCEDLGYTGGDLACGDDCQFDVSGCITDLCGNGELDAGEDCDGDELGGETCEDFGFTSGALGCNDDCTFDMDACEGGCGNGVVDGDDECDGDDLDGETCDSLGYSGGALSCTDECVFDVSSCGEAMGRVGDPCLSDEDCDSEWCLDEFRQGLPMGYCVAECDPNDYSCPGGAICMDLGVPVCLDSCDITGDDCRNGYECVDVGEGEGVCWANCDSDSQCGSTDYCNVDEGFCECTPGTHLDDTVPDCVYDDCDYLSCENLNMTCDPTGGCEGDCAACDSCDPADYVESDNHCYPSGSFWGGECEKDADCPGTGMPGEDTFCQPYTGGFCEQVNGPDFVAEGEPCAGDPGSVGYIEDYGSSGSFNICAQSCEINDDCRPGYHCDDAPETNADITICRRIDDCDTTGCNDSTGDLYCADSGQCWFDACADDPCATVDNSTGTCFNSGDDYACECGSEYLWNPDTMACEEFTCPADDLGTWDGTAIEATGDSCNGTLLYGNSSLECTGFQAAGEELVYSLTVPNGETIEITQTPIGGNEQDSSLYILTACNDLDGVTCLAGADNTYGGEAETLTWTNDTGAALMIYIVADAYSGCGQISLDIQ